jgi:endonuclease YncB( thermonuclease family)
MFFMKKSLLVLLVALFPVSLQATEYIGKVVSVTDGDTIVILVNNTQHKIRLTGVDAPESGQPYGTAARQHLSDLVFGKEVRVESDQLDGYGRVLGKVWAQSPDCPSCGKNLDANLGMLTVGLAWWYRYYKSEQSEKDQGRYEFAEYEAKAKRVGLWQDDNPIAPWDWRRGESGETAAENCNIKGNIYHMPGQRYYNNTKINESKGEKWFCSESDARAAGWRKAKV